MVVTRAMQGLGHWIWVPPTELLGVATTSSAKEIYTAYLAKAPLGALVWVPFAYMVASFVGGVVSARASRDVKIPLALGVVFTAFTGGMLMGITHPLWMWPLMLSAFIPFFYLGARWGLRMGVAEK